MYHIIQDKRARRSAQRICSALTTCLQQKPFDKITITDIQKVSFVSRATFYRLFDSLEDVLACQIDARFEAMLAAIEREPQQQRLQAAFAHWMQMDPGLLQALHDCNRADILLAAHDRYKERVRAVLLPACAGGGSQADHLMAALGSLIAGTLIYWVENGRRQTAQELYVLTGSLHTLAQALETEVGGCDAVF